MNASPIASTSILPSYAASTKRPDLLSQLATCLKKVSNVSARMSPRDCELVDKLKVDIFKLNSNLQSNQKKLALRDAAKLKKHAKELGSQSINQNIGDLFHIASDIKMGLKPNSTKPLTFDLPPPTYGRSELLIVIEKCKVHLSLIRKTTPDDFSRNTQLCEKIEVGLNELKKCIVKNRRKRHVDHDASAGKHIFALNHHSTKLLASIGRTMWNTDVKNLCHAVKTLEGVFEKEFKINVMA